MIREYAEETRHRLFLDIISCKWRRISSTMRMTSRISTVKFYRGCIWISQESDNMTITRCDILHDTLVHDSDCSYTFLLLVGEHLSFRRHVWILELVRIFLLVFEWLQGLPRTIKTSSENTETDENTWCARVVALYRES